MKKILLYLVAILTPFIFISGASAAPYETRIKVNNTLAERGSFVYVDTNATSFSFSPSYTISWDDTTTDAYVDQTFTDEFYIVTTSGEFTTASQRCNNVAISIKDLGYKASLPNSTWMDGEVYLFTVTWTATDSGDDADYGVTWFSAPTCNVTINNNSATPWYMGYNTVNQSVGTNTNTNSVTQQQNSEIIKQNKESETTRKGIWQSLKDGISSIGGWFTELGNKLGDFFASLGNLIGTGFVDLAKSIGNFFTDLLNGIIDGLKSLFIPDDMSFVTDFVDSLESKLGFIGAIPGQIIEFAINLVSASWDSFDSISFLSISIFGYNFWDSQEIDLTEAINIFKPFKYVTDCICVVLCARTLNKWREQFTGGSSE